MTVYMRTGIGDVMRYLTSQGDICRGVALGLTVTLLGNGQNLGSVWVVWVSRTKPKRRRDSRYKFIFIPKSKYLSLFAKQSKKIKFVWVLVGPIIFIVNSNK